MTDPLPGVEPVPLSPPAEPIEGDSHQHLIAPLQELAREIGYRVEVRDLPEAGPGGWCDHDHRQIVIARGPANRQVRILVHELAHALGLGYGEYGREKAEVAIRALHADGRRWSEAIATGVGETPGVLTPLSESCDELKRFRSTLGRRRAQLARRGERGRQGLERCEQAMADARHRLRLEASDG